MSSRSAGVGRAGWSSEKEEHARTSVEECAGHYANMDFRTDNVDQGLARYERAD